MYMVSVIPGHHLSIAIIQSGKLEPLLYGEILTFSVKNLLF